MQELRIQHIAGIPSADAWRLVSQLDEVVHFHPKVKSVDLLTESNSGIGATRRCNFYDGTSVVEKVTREEKGNRLELQLSQFSMPFKSARVELFVERLGERRTRLTAVFHYEMKLGPLGALMNAVMIRPMMRGMLRDVMRGMEYRVKTGGVVGTRVPAAA